jgi:hypothetical protein
VTLNRSVAVSTPKLSLKTCTSHTVYLLLLVTAAALLFSTAYLLLTRAFTKLIMHITLIMSIALNVFVCLFELFLDVSMNLYLQGNLRVLLDYTILLFVSFLSLLRSHTYEIFSSWSHYFHRHCFVLSPVVLGVQVSHTPCLAFAPSRNGCCQAPQKCLLCRFHSPGHSSCIERVSATPLINRLSAEMRL